MKARITLTIDKDLKEFLIPYCKARKSSPARWLNRLVLVLRTNPEFRQTVDRACGFEPSHPESL